MKIIEVGEEIVFSSLTLLPRYFPLDFNVVRMELIRESSNEVLKPVITCEKVYDYLKLSFIPANIKNGDKFGVIVFDGSNQVIYKGKAMASDKDKEQIQDYTLTTKTNKKLKI